MIIFVIYSNMKVVLKVRIPRGANLVYAMSYLMRNTIPVKIVMHSFICFLFNMTNIFV